MSCKELLKAGQTAYQEKNYTKALAAFNKASTKAKRNGEDDLLAILDQRSNVHLKLGDAENALQDAMSMVRRNKADGRGYLKCGYLERMRDDYHSALKWYKHGLKNVPVSDRLHAQLEVQEKKMTELASKRRVLQKAKDPFKTLPAELAQYVVSYLEYRDVMVALQVSKDWSKVLVRMRPLLDTVDFRGCPKSISFLMMKTSLKRLSRHSRSLDMTRLSEPAMKLLRSNLERWVNYSNLEHLSITTKMPGVENLPFSKFNLRTLILCEQAIVGVFFVEHILRSCTSLEVLRIADFTSNVICSPRFENDPIPFRESLRVVDLRGTSDWASPFPSRVFHRKLLSRLPSLEEFQCHNMMISPEDLNSDVVDLSDLTRLRKLVLFNVVLTCWPTLPPTVQIWENHSIMITNTAINEKIGQLTALRVLRFVKITQPPLMSSFLPEGKSLPISHIDIDASPLFRDFPVFAAAGCLDNVEDLRLGGYHGDLDATIAVLDQFRSLEVLHLSQSSITGASIAEFLRTPGCRLRHVQLTDCENVSPDVIEWAKGRGTAITFRRSDAATASRIRQWGFTGT